MYFEVSKLQTGCWIPYCEWLTGLKGNEYYTVKTWCRHFDRAVVNLGTEIVVFDALVDSVYILVMKSGCKIDLLKNERKTTGID